MSYVSALANNAQIVQVTPGVGSYFSTPSEQLDPRLFTNESLNVTVRESILQLLFAHLSAHYVDPELWTKAWLAGSGVSYQWEAARDPGDLDCLVGVDYPAFRQSNPEFAGLGDVEISKMFNEDFVESLWPLTASFMGSFELTFYVNPQTDIRRIMPYAAYDLLNDEWTVHPQKNQRAPEAAKWDVKVKDDYTQAVGIIGRYTQALTAVQNATNPAARLNAERALVMATEQAADLFETVHAGRKVAFSEVGAGYGDFHNYRWQAGKRNGTLSALRKIKDFRDAALKSDAAQTYGVELPDARTLTRRAATRGMGK